MMSDMDLGESTLEHLAARNAAGIRLRRTTVSALITEIRRLRAESDVLRRQAAGHAERIAAKSELLGRCAEKPPAWSQEPPTAPGWYWWRDLPAQRERPIFVFHANVATGPLVMGRSGVVRPVTEPGAEWAGPIAPPAC